METELTKIQKILYLIEKSIENKIPIENIEKNCDCSYRNIQRFFKRIMNETIENYSKRKRLEKAYKKIIYTQETITDIAINFGYSSLQSFSKAFTKQFKTSPTEARQHKEIIFDYFIKDTNEQLKTEKVYVPKKFVFFKSVKTVNYNNTQLNKIWREIEKKNNLIALYESYGIIVDQPLITEHKNCIYEFAIDKISDLNQDLLCKEIFGRYYLKFTHFGCHNLIEETYKKFYKYWLTSNYQLAETEVIEHYVVSEKEHAEPKDFITHIYFPLK